MLRKIFKILKWTLIIFICTLITLIIVAYLYLSSLSLKPPVYNQNSDIVKRDTIAPDFYKAGENWIRKNEFGLWELYAEGKDFERGKIIGLLSQELVKNQEDYFIAKIKEFIPSDTYLGFLKYFIIFFNREIDKYIPAEYLREIYGVSLSASHEYDFIGTPYERILNYHGAHDIGHNLQNMNLVGCTSFALWNEYTNDSSLIIARNFDFYFGDDFSRDKIVCFINPEHGYKFVMITWGGMMGSVSGMNEHGLTVTINAAKSDFSFTGKTPVSIVARSVLQYSKNIDEAYNIISNAKMFVSESFLIGSAFNRKAVIIEKTDEKTSIFSEANNKMLCTNHFRSDELRNSKLNTEAMLQETSAYRLNRTNELINSAPKADVMSAISILRNPLGLDNKNIGFGNEKAINQFIAHHGVIFKPEERLIWVSTAPNQMGKYLCYDLKKIFAKKWKINPEFIADERSLMIPQDSLLTSPDYFLFQNFRKLKREFEIAIAEKKLLSDKTLVDSLVSYNKEYYLTYKLIGDYYSSVANNYLARKYYKIALTKEIANLANRERIIKLISN